MKKIYLSILSVMVMAGVSAQTAVTFTVNMNPFGPTDSLHVVGNLQDPNGDGILDNPDYQNWTPSAESGLMTDFDEDGYYTVVLNLVPARYEFKFVNGNSWASVETVPQTCRVEVNGNDNRQIMVEDEPVSYTVCFGGCADCADNAIRLRVDMSTYDNDGDGIGGEPNEDIHPDGVHVNGSFVNWSAFTPLQDWNNDKIWETVIVTSTADPILYKYINGPDWALPNETVVGSCSDGTQAGNRTLTITDANTVLPVYCWSSCDPCAQPVQVTFNVDMTASCLDTSPGVNLMGTLTDWGTGVPMADPEGDGIWTLTLFLAPGSYEYKFRIGDGGWEGIGNRQIAVVADTPQNLAAVCFNSPDPCGAVLAPADITFQVRPGAIQLEPGEVMWVMGDFTQPAWQDGALQMEDNDGDGTWTVTVPQVCYSSVFYKFRAGAPGGPDFIEETADFSSIGGCGIDNGTFSDNRQLIRTDGNPVTVCWTFDLCEACGPTGVEEPDIAESLSVYPVPAEEILNVQFVAKYAERMVIRLTNSIGQIVIEENLGVVAGQKTVTLNTQALATGVYALTLSNETKTQAVNVMIK